MKTSPVKIKAVTPTHPVKLPAPFQLAKAPIVHVLVADSGPLQSQLLTRALRARREFHVWPVALNLSALDDFLHSNPVDVVLIAGSQLPDWALLRWLRITHPKVAPVLLAENDDRELV